MTVVIERESQEKIECTVTADLDPTTLPIEFAFTATTERPSSWIAGSWESTPGSLAGTTWSGVARTPVVGTGGLDLAVGTYQVWARLTAGAEVPVVKVDRLKVR